MRRSEAGSAHALDDVQRTDSWLLVERLENWTRDEQDGFKQFGLPDRRVKQGKSIKKGDLLFFYVSSGRSRFADIREATEPGVTKLRLGGDYDTPFPWCVRTRPVLTLPPERWVPIKPMIGTLAFTKASADWRQVMRNSLRKLDSGDAATILRAMRLAAITKEDEQ